MSSFNVADTKVDAKSVAAGSSAATAFDIDEMTAALVAISRSDDHISIKKEAGATISVTRTDEDDDVPKDDGDDASAKVPKVLTKYWEAFYRAGPIKYDSPLKGASGVFEKVKNRVWRNKVTGQLVHDRPTLLGVHIGTLVDPAVQTGGFVFGSMHVRDCRVHLPFVGKGHGMLSWMNVTVPLNESKGTTCTDGSAQAFRKRVAAAGTKEFVANLMCSTVQRVAVYAPASRGSKGESASLCVCFDFYALAKSHYLNEQVMYKRLQRNLLVWDILVQFEDGPSQHITVCGVAGLLEIMSLSNVRATYGLNQSSDTADKEEGTGRGKKLLYPGQDNLTGGMFGILHNYLMQGIIDREASPASAAAAALSEEADNRVEEAERRNADLARRNAESEAARRVANEGLAMQTSRAIALAAEVDRMKKEALRLVGTIKALQARDAKLIDIAKNPAMTDAKFRAGVVGTLTPQSSAPSVSTPPALERVATAAPASLSGAAISGAARPASAAATPRVASNQPAGYTTTDRKNMSDS